VPIAVAGCSYLLALMARTRSAALLQKRSVCRRWQEHRNGDVVNHWRRIALTARQGSVPQSGHRPHSICAECWTGIVYGSANASAAEPAQAAVQPSVRKFLAAFFKQGGPAFERFADLEAM
jgi:hypothetical protein